MKSYTLTESTKGYLIRSDVERGYATTEMYAFSTLKEVQDFLPDLFKPNEPGVGE